MSSWSGSIALNCKLAWSMAAVRSAGTSTSTISPNWLRLACRLFRLFFVEVGHTANGLDAERSVWVVKPAIGAGSNGAKRCTRAEVDAHIVVLHALGRAAMVQPYLDMIDAESETSLVFINDGSGLRYDHAFSKAAILQEARVAAGLKRNGDLVVKEEIGLREATDEQIGLAEQVLASAPVQAVGPLAYARVDVVPTPTGSVLMELELIEPSLYFNSSEGSAARAASGWQQFLASTARCAGASGRTVGA